jgi:hypothetical protein
MKDEVKLLWNSITSIETGMEAKIEMFKNYIGNPSKLQHMLQGMKTLEDRRSKGNLS